MSTPTISSLSDRVFRVTTTSTDDSTCGLRRYGVLPELPSPIDVDSTRVQTRLAALEYESGSMRFLDGDGVLRLEQHVCDADSDGNGFRIGFRLEPGERIYGLGDVTRERLDKRGYATQVWVTNVESYVPSPILLSSRGWALFVETTWRHFVDVDSTGSGELTIWAHGGDLAYMLAIGENLRELLEAMTEVVGRPTLLPLWGYGLTFVCNQQADARAMLGNCLAFRDRGIPCDTIGLEPGWMSKHYDYTVEKEWHPERFQVPYWGPKGPHTFLGAAERLGFKMSLWLCCDYDLSEIEERWARERETDSVATDEDTLETRLLEGPDHGHHPIHADHLTKPGEPWFDHLKKFVDQGVSAFKLDGANQVNEHPDRGWANGMSDEEMHNLYPALLNKQMSRGFEEHTGRRPLIYSSGGYSGIQRFSATWAGDTGGGNGPLVSMLNHGLSGHSNTSCDMDVFSKPGIHFGFLMPWSQACSWAYWKHPWFLGDELEAVFADYAKLRYRLLPYIYSAAHVAHRTGMPIMRAMHLQFPDDKACLERLSQYMLGDSLLVGTFDETVYTPRVSSVDTGADTGADASDPTGWVNFWTGVPVPAGIDVTPEVPANRGGVLLVRSGSIIPMWPQMSFVGQSPVDHVELHIYPGGESSTSLYEDDGVSLGYRDGSVAVTDVSLSGQTVSIGPRIGSYDGIRDRRAFRLVVHTPDAPDGRAPIDVQPAPDETIEVQL